MLSYPRKLIFGSDQPKLDFKLSDTYGIARLYSERHIPYHDSKYWFGFLQFQSPADIFALLSLTDLRKAKEHAPENVVTLVRVMVAHLEALLVDPLFTVPPLEPRSTTAEGLAGRLGNIADVSKWKLSGVDGENLLSGQKDRVTEALNVIRILTRALPAVMEDSDPSLERQVLWSQSPDPYGYDSASSQASNPPAISKERDESTQFVIEDDDDTIGDKSSSSQLPEQEIKHPLSSQDQLLEGKEDTKDVPESLCERLIRLTVDLLFYAGFTIPWSDDQAKEVRKSSQPNRVNYSIWEAGVGSSVELQGTSRQHVSNRVEVLRLLLVLMSKSMYVPADQQSTTQDPALRFAVQDLERDVMLPLLCSLINTSVSNARNSTSSWLGLPNVGGLVAGSNDEVRIALVTHCLQILDVILAYDPPTFLDSDTVSLSTIGAPLPGPGGRNVFRFYLSKLHRTADFNFIWTYTIKSFDEHINASTQILAISIPTAQGRRGIEASWQLNQVAERLILLWRMMEHNSKFRAFVLDDPKRAPELLTVLLYFSLTYKDNVALQGLVRLCAFILQDASGDRAFALNLARQGSAAKVHLPGRIGLSAGNTAIDFLVQGVYSLIATTKGQLSGLHAPLVIALSNTASVWRSLSITASTRVVQLLRSFSQPSFLLSDEGNPRLLFYILETINAVLTCQYSANPNLVYALVLGHKLIDGLESFTLRKGVEEIWNRRRALGTDTRDWFENVPRLEKPPLPPSATATSDDEDTTGSSSIGKGKTRSNSTSSVKTSSSPFTIWDGELSKYSLEAVEDVASRYIGKSGFQPTQAWVESWKVGLPLRTPRIVIDKLLPEVLRIAAGGPIRTGSNNETATEITGGSTDARVLVFLREQIMSDYLPPPGSGLHARPWQWSNQATVWLRSYLWGTIYVSALLPYGLWSDTEIRLFRIHERPDARRQPTSNPASLASSRTASRRPSLIGPETEPNLSAAPIDFSSTSVNDRASGNEESASESSMSTVTGVMGSMWNATRGFGRQSISRTSTPTPDPAS